MLELHCHTTYSDGTLTPEQLVEMAAKAGVKALAITDHDTLAGWDEAIAAAAKYQLKIVPGVELSTVYNGRSLHILGFYPERSRLETPLAERLEGRRRRAQKIVENLARLGCPLEVPSLKGNMAPGRPHIASALVKAGYVASAREAFDRFLGDDKPAYVPYEKFSAREGIELLRSCGGVPVWAHPYLFQGGEVEEVLQELVDAGLMGIEVYHPSHTPTQIQTLKSWCSNYGLSITGGTDYHGPDPQSPDRHDNKLNQFQLPYSLLEALEQAARQLV